LSTLYQQLSLPIVTTVVERLKYYYEDNYEASADIIQDFEEKFRRLSDTYSEAKDNVKFLQTLERQFKNLATEGKESLKIVEETIPSLMNGLNLIWTISRHYKQDNKMEQLFQKITNEISLKVEK